MTEPILDDVCQQPRLIATTEKYAQLVHDSTIELHQPVHSILSALDRRAIGLTKCTSFESALRDANLMQQLSPSSPLGYLRAAEVYSQQGRQSRVIDICNKGLCMVDPSDTHCATLQKLQTVAMERGNSRIDFISQLPIDIVITTLIPMIMENNKVKAFTPCPYLQVSNVWRDRIVQCFNGLRFEVDEGDDRSQAVQFAQHTKSLHIYQTTDGNWLSDLIKDNGFSSLEDLQIYGYRGDDIDELLSALKSVSSTLTRLEVDFYGVYEFSTHELLLACPNLLTFEIHQAPDLDFDIPATLPNLTTLSIFEADEPITCDQIISICKRFPSLKDLSLYPCKDFSSALIISEYLPRLKWLHIEMVVTSVRLSYSDQAPQSDEPGLTRLVTECDEEELEDHFFEDIGAIIMKHHNTLQDLIWALPTCPGTANSGCNVQYPRLKKFYTSCAGWQIPRNAPMLEDLVLNSTIISEHPEVLDATPLHLKKLEFYLFDPVHPADKSSIIRFLNRISQRLGLKELNIVFNSLDTIDNMLDPIYLHHHLECLKIRFTGEWDSNRMDTFLHGLVEACPRLVSLELIAKMAPTPSSVITLKRLEHLKEFTFSPAREIQDENSFWHAIRTFDQLKSIKLHPTDIDNNPSIVHLKHQRPDISIIRDMYLIPLL
ncbi:predicted protein [Lichtheimia corymbifera JMRC:FSU:9682]|uniref:F-box domain-containing protein n=1 Tax=Lichtheimia corymbifera JMRC:FSU:9682 TaxID=1263082 RepID=A0A068SHC8_9FUNG|nr:predicted protein [Lichtheimia corymbifera JMRC:FSU:9682]